MRRAFAILLACGPVHAAAVSGPPPYYGPILQRFFSAGPVIDGVPVIAEEWRCWTGDEWLPFADPACQQAIFRGYKPPPIPPHQRRME